MPEKLVVIDGNSLANRAFYAIRELRTSGGVPTNAVYGFINMLLKLLEDEKPDYMAVAFDRGAPTFRHKEYDQYKATRTGMPEDLGAQMPVIKRVIGAFNIKSYEIDGWEADDIIGTAATIAEKDGISTVIVTGDRDTLQLVSDKTTVLYTKRGITDIVRFTRTELPKLTGLSAAQVPDYKALVGDASDNIPGVPGIGDKTALKLLAEFGSIESIIENRSSIPGKTGDLIDHNLEQMKMSKHLATIVTDVPIEISLADCKVVAPDNRSLANLLAELEFRSLMNRLSLTLDSTQDVTGDVSTKSIQDAHTTTAVTTAQAVATFRNLAMSGPIALSCDCKNGGVPAALFVSNENESATLCFGSGQADFAQFVAGCRKELGDRSILKMGHDAKRLIVAIRRRGVRVRGLVFDSAVAAYLLDPSRATYRLTDLAREHLGVQIAENAPDGWQSRAIYRLRAPTETSLKENGMYDLFEKVEMPLVSILAGMEAEGVSVNTASLRDMSGEFAVRIDALVASIYEMAGFEFNINSTKQLGEVLFDKLGLPATKKTRTGYSTDAEVLEALAPRHPIAGKLLEYRQLVKLKGTYIDGLQDIIDGETGRVHTTFNQTVTATGRLSSAEPNLQNIPIRQEEGRLIRKVFVPSHRDTILLAGDYSQIELRILSHISGDENMRAAFRSGKDIHTSTAAEVFGVPLESVTADMRQAAKAVNFGIVYGISDFGLSQNLGISREKARTYIDSYFSRYPGVKRWMENIVAEAGDKGYVTTLLGRRRYLPDIQSKNRVIRQFAERTAINTPIQGSAADLIKLAMVKIDEELDKSGFKTAMLLQVHDELIFEVPLGEQMIVSQVIKEIMANCMHFEVPIVVDLKVGPNWCDMERL